MKGLPTGPVCWYLCPVRDFHKLKVWRAAHHLVLDVYRCSDGFPGHERFGLTSQMRRAALSIPTNIAEGAGRPTRPDYGRFLSVSLGSVNELQYLLVVARDLGYLESATYRALHEPLVEVRRMLLALRRSVVTGS